MIINNYAYHSLKCQALGKKLNCDPSYTVPLLEKNAD